MDSHEIAMIEPNTHHHMNSEILESLLGHPIIFKNKFRNAEEEGTMKKNIEELLKSYGRNPNSCNCKALHNFKKPTGSGHFLQNDKSCLNPDLCLTRSRYLPCQSKCSLACKNNPFEDVKWTNQAFYVDGSDGTWTLHSHGEIVKNQPVMEYAGVFVPKGSLPTRHTNPLHVINLPFTGFDLDATKDSNLAKYARKSKTPNVLAHVYIHQSTVRVIFIACKHIARDGEILWNFPKVNTKLIKVKESKRGQVQDFILPLSPGGENISDMSLVRRVQDGLASIQSANKEPLQGTFLRAYPPPTINIIVPVPVLPTCNTIPQQKEKTKDEEQRAVRNNKAALANTVSLTDTISEKVAKVVLEKCKEKIIPRNLALSAENQDSDNQKSIESGGLSYDHKPAPPSPNQHASSSESSNEKQQQRKRERPSSSKACKGTTTDRAPWNPSTKIDKHKTQASQDRLSRHSLSLSGQKAPKCRKCSFVGNTLADLTEHYKDKHPATHPCILPPCEGQFWSEKQLRDHLISVHKKGTYYLCPQRPCQSSFPTQELLRIHLRDIHG